MYRYDVSIRIGLLGLTHICQFKLDNYSDAYSVILKAIQMTVGDIHNEDELLGAECQDWYIRVWDEEFNRSSHMRVNAESNETTRRNLHHFLCLRMNITDTSASEIVPEPVEDMNELLALMEVQ